MNHAVDCVARKLNPFGRCLRIEDEARQNQRQILRQFGGNVPLTNPVGILGLDNDGNSVDSLKTCEQSNEQNN